MYPRPSIRLTCAALSVVALGALSQVASAQTFYTTGTYTVDAAHSVTGYAYVGKDSNGNAADSQVTRTIPPSTLLLAAVSAAS